MNTILEPEKNIPIIDDVDLCVLGGSCTGVFAAVRAARLGLKVAIVEKQNCFGGVAASGLINIWHKLYDAQMQKQLIGGLTQEVIERLKRIGEVEDLEKDLPPDEQNAYIFNNEELKIELDRLVTEHKIHAYLHTQFAACVVKDSVVQAVFIENKSGRGAITAGVFVDATGDGDLCVRAGLDSYRHRFLQPPTACCKMQYDKEDALLEQKIIEHGEEFGLAKDRGWMGEIPGVHDIYMNALTHVFDVDCSDAAQLTYAEMEGRRQIRAYMDILRTYYHGDFSLVSLCSYIGIRQTRQIRADYQLKDDDVTGCAQFEDGIANVSYPIDFHLPDGTMEVKYFSGNYKKILLDGTKETGRWREEQAQAGYYQVPFRSMVNKKIKNLIMAGRMIDCEMAAFSSLRVMVSCNQMGEAAGVAAYLALQEQRSVSEVDPAALRALLQKGGSTL